MDTHFAAQSGRVKVWLTRQLRFVACVSGLFVLFTLPVAAQTNPLVVSTVAGLANFGSADGIGSAAKFLLPGGVAVDGAGNVYVADADNDTIREVTSAGVVSTLAGTEQVSGTNDGTGSAARFNLPYGVAVDSLGNVFVADTYNQTIRQVTTNGGVTTFAGLAGIAGFRNGSTSSDPSIGAVFSYPYGIAVDGSNNIYVADTYNNMIRMIANGSGTVMTLAGGLASGTNNGTGTNAQFHEPFALAADGAGNVYVADTYNYLIRRITPAGVVTNLAGSGSIGTNDGIGANAQFAFPTGIAVDGATNIYVADYTNQVIREITLVGANWVVSTLAGDMQAYGDGDGISPQATFYNPWGVAVDSATNVYVGDSGNGTIRKITPGVFTLTLTSTLTLAGPDGSYGLADGPAAQGRFHQPFGVAVDGASNLYVADYYNNCIREVTAAGTVTTLAGSVNGDIGSADGTNNNAAFYYPSGLCVDAATNIYVADSYNSTVRKITPDAAHSNWVTTTIAGQVENFNYADGIGSNALFYVPSAVAVDSATNLYVADTYNDAIRMIIPNGTVSTYAGNPNVNAGYMDATGTNALFNTPNGIAVDINSNVYVADSGNNAIRQIAPGGVVTTLTNGGLFNFPEGVAVDGVGNVYVANTGANTILGINAGGKVTTTIAGTAGLVGSADGLGSAAQFDTPVGLAVDASGNVYVADVLNNTIRKGTPYTAQTAVLTLTTSPTNGGTVSGGGRFVVGTTHTVTATADSGYVFTNWTQGGTVASPSSNYTFVLGSNVTLIANFATTPPQIEVFNGTHAITNGQTNAVNFGSVQLNQTGPAITFMVTNSGGQTLDLEAITVPSGYTLNTNFPATIAAGSNGTFSVQLNSITVGANTGNISITNNDPTNSPIVFAVTGIVTPRPPQIQVLNGASVISNGQTAPVSFGSVQQNQTGATVTFTVTNSGGQTLDLEAITVPSGYTLNTNFPATIAAGSNGAFSVQLNSITVGANTGNISITNNVSTNSPFVFAVTGIVTPRPPQIQVFTGTNAITNGQTAPVSFGSVQQNQTGATVTFTVTNSGGQTLDLEAITVPASYTLNTNFPATIAAGSNGTFSVQLTTNTIGAYSGNITITNNNPANNPFTFPITGLITAKIISLSGNLVFGVVPVGSSATNILTISNGGNVPLNVSNIIYPPGYPGGDGFRGNWSEGVITNGESHPVTVIFSPASPTNFSGTVTVYSDATSGANTISISAFGANTNLLLTVLTSGEGTVTPKEARPLKQGAKVSLKAVAGSADVFSSWTGSTNSTNNPLTFIMEKSTILQANFIPNPFLPFVGTYNGLFWATNGIVAGTNAGMLKGLTLTSKGTYSGSLLINGASKSISGSFNATGQASKSISLGSQEGKVEVVMTLTSNDPAPQVTGTVAGTGWGSTNLTADRATNNSQISAEYTLLIPPDTNNTSSPSGYGYALITGSVGTAKTPATAKITGALADGAAFSQSAPVSQDGYVPIYANLYSGKGLLLGWINLDPTNAPGGLTWVHPVHPGLFTGAFTSTNQIALSPWTNPPAKSALPTNLVVVETTANIPVQTNEFTIMITNGTFDFGKLSGPATRLNGSIAPKTGLLKMTFGGGASKTTGYGVILLNETNGGGYFLTKTNAGAIILQP